MNRFKRILSVKKSSDDIIVSSTCTAVSQLECKPMAQAQDQALSEFSRSFYSSTPSSVTSTTTYASAVPRRVNLGATCCQAAPLVAYAASLENELVVLYRRAHDATAAFSSTIEEYFPIYEIAVSLVKTYSQRVAVVRAFATSLNLALSKYASYVSRDSQEDCVLIAGLFARALQSEMLV